MSHSISIKELRQNLSHIANQVNKGEIFEVYRRSKLSFKIVPVDTKIDENWKTVIDFTQEGKCNGLEIEKALKVLQ